ncbi:MAG: DUF362 domain-containing protein [Proteobacteria bacterium]|nr:DUF362 domain-containing protein [Pseudomonadota bacterium]NIS68116.1 DUF362 domain-containing protein [Pseudomonadota bacterium]
MTVGEVPGYFSTTMKSQISVVQCDGYDQDRVFQAVRRSVDLLGGIGRFVRPGQRVLLKPNLLVPSSPERGVVTHPMVVKAVLEMVKKAGGVPVIGDSPGFGTAHRVAAKAGIAQVGEEMGCPILDFEDTVEVKTPDDFTFRRFEVAREAVECDVVINLPKIKTHAQMLLTLSVKNMFGCIPGFAKPGWHLKAGRDRNYFARMLVELNAVLKPHLTIMDGIVAMEGRGPSSGNTRPLDMVLAGTDCVALDSTVTHLLGLPRDRLWTTRAAMEDHTGIATPDRIELLGASLVDLAVSRFEIPQAWDVTWGLPSFIQGFLRDAVTPRPVIDRDRCKECLNCVEVCPPNAMKKEAEGIVIDPEGCIRCYCCQEICPEGAIEIRAGLLSRALGIFRGCGSR